MGYRLYILSIRDLMDEKVLETAITYLDSHRLALVNKYKREQDRLRAIAAGLLLQVGFLELEVGDDVSSKEVRLQVSNVLERLQDYAIERAISLPLPLSYEYGTHGKPNWERRCIDEFWGNKEASPEACKGKKYPYFNLSHSGDYVVLAISETPIGVDIQMERECNYTGGSKAFSRMEAYVKCTGEGIAHGGKKYEEMSKDLLDFATFEMEFFDKNLYNVVITRQKYAKG